MDLLRKSGGVALRSGCFVAFYLSCELAGLLLSAALWLARPFARWDAESWRELHYRLQDGWGTALFRGAVPARNRRNAYWGNLANGSPVFPHAAMYRGAMLEVIDEAALATLHSGPEVRVRLTRAPRWLGVRTAFAVAGVAEAVEHAFFGPPVHPQLPLRLGFRADFDSVRNCRTPEELADLALASSCTPPFTPLLHHRGEPALDGGIADNVPVSALGDAGGRTLVLLARRYADLPEHPSRVYVQPSTDLPVASWDYTNPAGLQAAYDIGRRDGEAFVRDLCR